jgi:formylglycine-generating enzyme required for sulfatase activity
MELARKPISPIGMVYSQGGEFILGSENGKSEAEKPTQKVSVGSFFIDVYEVTNAQYLRFVNATNHKMPTEWKNRSIPKDQDNYPVVGVNWDDANAYAKWAGKRLPTEEEWEFAASGIDNFKYPWGNAWKLNIANIEGKGFVEVGKFKVQSPLGLFDMVGNAWEWTASDFKAYSNGKLPPIFSGKSNLKTIRGGSFESTREYATTSYRIGWAAIGAETYSRVGFRCVKDIDK